MATASKAKLALEFSRTVTEMKNTVRRNIEGRVREAGLDISFELLEIIGVLWNNDGITQQDLGAIVVKDKSSVTYLINSLVERKLVRRVEDKNDRRSKKIFLTALAKKERNLIYSWVMDMYTKATADINGSDIKKSIALVKQMTESLGL